MCVILSETIALIWLGLHLTRCAQQGLNYKSLLKIIQSFKTILLKKFCMRTKVLMFRPRFSTPVMNTFYAAQAAFDNSFKQKCLKTYKSEKTATVKPLMNKI